MFPPKHPNRNFGRSLLEQTSKVLGKIHAVLLRYLPIVCPGILFFLLGQASSMLHHDIIEQIPDLAWADQPEAETPETQYELLKQAEHTQVPELQYYR